MATDSREASPIEHSRSRHSRHHRRHSRERRHRRSRRSRSPSTSHRRHHSHHRSRDVSDGDSAAKRASSVSSSSPSRSRSRSRSHRKRSKDQQHHRKKSHRSKDREERWRHRHHSRDDSRSPERKSRKSKKKRRKEKDGKSSSTRSKVSAINQQYGKHGVLYETDIYTKEEEFNLWLYETKKLRPEEMSNPDSKRHFREFMEDYNTVTLPHEKYYNLRQWEDKHGHDHSQIAAKDTGLYGGMDLLRDAELATRQRRQANYDEAQKASHMPYMTKDHLLQLKQSETSRLAADKLRQMGYSSKDTTGFRF